MSVKVAGWVWDQPFQPVEKLILLKLADHAHHDGTNVYPSVAEIAHATGIGDRQVQRYLRDLVNRGVLVIDDRLEGGRGRSRVYRFTFAKGDAHDTLSRPVKGDIHDTVSADRKGDAHDTLSGEERVTSGAIKGDTQGTERVTSGVVLEGDTLYEPSVNRQETSSGAERPTKSETKSGRKATPKNQPTRIPDNFSLTSAMAAVGEALNFTDDEIEFEFEQFVDYWRSSSKTHLDWEATWRVWIRNEAKRREQRGGAQIPRTRSRRSSSRPPTPPPTSAPKAQPSEGRRLAVPSPMPPEVWFAGKHPIRDRGDMLRDRIHRPIVPPVGTVSAEEFAAWLKLQKDWDQHNR
jgi:hypothetical protein